MSEPCHDAAAYVESIGKFEKTVVRHEPNELVFVIRTTLSPMLYHRPSLGQGGK
jgi:hypothetical protein